MFLIRHFKITRLEELRLSALAVFPRISPRFQSFSAILLRYDICGVGGVINLHFRASSSVRTLLGTRFSHAVFDYGLERIYVFFTGGTRWRTWRTAAAGSYLLPPPSGCRPENNTILSLFSSRLSFFFFFLTFFAKGLPSYVYKMTVPLSRCSYLFIYLNDERALFFVSGRSGRVIVVRFKINQVHKNRGFVFLTGFRPKSTKDLFPRRLGEVVYNDIKPTFQNNKQTIIIKLSFEH